MNCNRAPSRSSRRIKMPMILTAGFSMHPNYTAIALLLGSFLAFPCPAQNALTVNPRFEHVTISDGLSQGMVNAIFQDSRGFMWFGTKDGLNRYDGYTFKVYRHNPFDSTSISGNYIQTIIEDRTGCLWIGTIGGGLNRFDPATETFWRFKHNPADANSLSGNDIYAICEEKNEGTNSDIIIWVGLNTGLNRLALRMDNPDKAKTITDYSPYLDHLDDSIIYSLLIDTQNVLWCSTRRGLFQLRLQANGTERGEDIRVHKPYGDDAVDQHANACETIFQSPDGALWIGFRDGLSRLDSTNRASGRFENFHYPEGLISVPEFVTTKGICTGDNGWLWLATRFDGLILFNPQTKTFRVAKAQQDNATSLNSNWLTSMFRDRAGIIWIGAAGYGLNKYDPRKQGFHSFPQPDVPAWILPGNGLGKIDTELMTKHYAYLPPRVYFFDFDSASGAYNLHASIQVRAPVYEDSLGVIWALKSDGYYRYKPKASPLIAQNGASRLADPGAAQYLKMTDIDFAGKYSRMIGGRKVVNTSSLYEDMLNYTGVEQLLPDSLNIWVESSETSAIYFTGMVKDAEGRMWTVGATENKIGLGAWDSANERFEFHILKTDKALINLDDPFKRGFQDHSGAFWFPGGGGLCRIDIAANSVKVYHNDPQNKRSLNQDFLKSILQDPVAPDRFLWVGTNGGGLNRFEYAGETFIHYTEKDGLPNNVIYGILAGNDGDLWVSTNRGLSNVKIDAKTREVAEFKNYSAKSGLQGDEFNTDAFWKTREGDMVFGGLNGVTIFHPDSIKDNPHPPLVAITNLQVHHKPMSLREWAPQADSGMREIFLPYSDNALTFEFTALDFSAPEKNRYSFMLENFDSDWSAPTLERKTNYTNIDPGEYVFRVRGANNDGVWNEEGAAIKIIITQPWWKTSWAYLSYFVLILGAALGAHRFELRRRVLQHKYELEMVEIQKLLELDQHKSHFFANISHEFRTPLTLIEGPLQSMLGKCDYDNCQRNFSMIERNTKRLLKLINELLDLSKCEAGSMTLKVAKGDMVRYLKQIIALFDSAAASKGIELCFESSRDVLECYFEMDKMHKVIVNLLSNAIKFTQTGGRINLAVGPATNGAIKSDSSPGFVGICVSDTGIGIDENRLPHLFEKFYRVADAQRASQQNTDSQTHYTEGSGIGLALVKELVELHHGEVHVQSELGVGSTFTIRLPLGKAHLKEDEIDDSPMTLPVVEHVEALIASENINIESKDTTGKSGHGADTHKGAIVLVVEDNPDMRDYIREQLETEYTVIEAADGEAGIKKALSFVPDLIISDVMMPRKDGYQLCEALKNDVKTSHIPIIMLTAKAGQENKIEGLETGVDAYLVKPFTPKELLVRVRNLIEMRRKLRQRFSQMPIVHPSEIAVTPVDRQFFEHLQKIVEEKMGDKEFQISQLCRRMGMSERQLRRKLHALLGLSPKQYLRKMRLQRAKQLLEQKAGNITQIAFSVGYASSASFAKAFRDEFGKPPSAFRHKSS